MTLTHRPYAAARPPGGGPAAHRRRVALLATGALALAGVGAAPTAAVAAPPAPVVHYTFDDDPAGAVVTDTSGSGLDGTLVHPGTATSVPGLEGSALRLPGGSPSSGAAYVELPRGVLEGAAELTVSLRLDWTGTGGSWQWMYALGANTSRYLFTTPANGVTGGLRTAVTSTGGGGEAQVTGAQALPSGRWQTVTVTLSDGQLTTYLDGVRVGSAPTDVRPAELLTGSARVAGYLGRSFYADPQLSGALDDFRVWHTALADDEVAALVPGQLPELVALTRTDVALRTPVGTPPTLPADLTGEFTDGYPRGVPVVWDAVPPEAYAAPGQFTVAGSAAGHAVMATVTVLRAGELVVDLGADTGEFHGGAAGVLYGLYADDMPSDALVEGFGLRTVATKGQDGAQHPGSDALEVLGPLARTTDGKVYVRTTDFYRGFPYQWPGDTPAEKLAGYRAVMERQLDQIAAVLAEHPDLAANVVVEPFNEPEGNMFGTGTWSLDRTSWLDDPTDFFAAWDDAHALITQKLPGVEIAGPGASVLFDEVRGFLEHTVAAGTVPDIITWHELSDPATVRESVERFRGWEDEVYAGTALAGSHLPININEYAFNYHTSVPGQMVQWISAIEESKAEAMIAFWNINGNLSDSAVRSNRANGQWWLYNAYSGMSGRTVAVDPPSPGESYTLQAVATVDMELRRAQVLLGGAGGPSWTELRNVPADVFGERVRVTVREIPWSGQLGDSPQPRFVAETTADVVDGRVVLDFGGEALPELVESSAYQVLVTPAGTGRGTSAAPLLVDQSYEAEDAAWTGGGYLLNGPEGSPTNLAGYYTSGGHNVGGLRTGSDGVLTFDVEVPEDGTYDLGIYSSSLNRYPAVEEQGPTNVFVRVDGAAEQEVLLPLAYQWVVWDQARTTVELTAGPHTIELAAQSLDGTGATRGDAIVDRIVLQRANPAASTAVYEAELAEVRGGTVRYDLASTVSGSGAVQVGPDDELTFWVYSARDGESTLTVDVVGSGAGVLRVGDREVARLAGSTKVPVALAGGVNKVVVSGAGGGSISVDRLLVDPTTTALPVATHQAQDAVLAGDAAVVDLTFADGGRAVTGVGGAPGNQNTLTFEVEAAEAGPHAFAVRFANPEQMPATHYNPNPMGRHADVSVNGGDAQRFMFVPTFHENNFWERTLVLDLAEGSNTVTFAAEEQPNWDGADYVQDLWPGLALRSGLAPILDRIAVSPLAGTPTALAPPVVPDPDPDPSPTPTPAPTPAPGPGDPAPGDPGGGDPAADDGSGSGALAWTGTQALLLALLAAALVAAGLIARRMTRRSG